MLRTRVLSYRKVNENSFLKQAAQDKIFLPRKIRRVLFSHSIPMARWSIKPRLRNSKARCLAVMLRKINPSSVRVRPTPILEYVCMCVTCRLPRVPRVVLQQQCTYEQPTRLL